MKKILTIIFLFSLSVSVFGKDHPVILKMSVKPFKDTLVNGIENQFILKSELKLENLTIEATNCTVSVTDAKKGQYVVRTSMADIGKTAIVKVIYTNDKGNSKTMLTKEIPVVGLSTSMANRLTKKK